MTKPIYLRTLLHYPMLLVPIFSTAPSNFCPQTPPLPFTVPTTQVTYTGQIISSLEPGEEHLQDT